MNVFISRGARAATCTVVLATTLSLGACGIGPKGQAPAGNWDFGPPAVSAPPVRIKALAALEVVAPRWLDSTNAYYRLGYASAAQPMAYGQTRWVMPPGLLIDARIRERLVAGGATLGGGGPTLKLELDEFAQWFDSEKVSRGVLMVRATLWSGREILRQRQFVVDEPALTPDGPGGAAALSRSADRLVDAVLDWAAGS